MIGKAAVIEYLNLVQYLLQKELDEKIIIFFLLITCLRLYLQQSKYVLQDNEYLRVPINYPYWLRLTLLRTKIKVLNASKENSFIRTYKELPCNILFFFHHLRMQSVLCFNEP